MATVTVRNYCLGFALSLLCTLAAFGMIEAHILSHHTLFSHDLLRVAVVVLAVVQFGVQLAFFLHLRSRGRMQLAMLAFAAVLVFVVVGGSIWIMYSLGSRMTPSADQMLQYMQDQSGAW